MLASLTFKAKNTFFIIFIFFLSLNQTSSMFDKKPKARMGFKKPVTKANDLFSKFEQINTSNYQEVVVQNGNSVTTKSSYVSISRNGKEEAISNFMSRQRDYNQKVVPTKYNYNRANSNNSGVETASDSESGRSPVKVSKFVYDNFKRVHEAYDKPDKKNDDMFNLDNGLEFSDEKNSYERSNSRTKYGRQNSKPKAYDYGRQESKYGRQESKYGRQNSKARSIYERQNSKPKSGYTRKNSSNNRSNSQDNVKKPNFDKFPDTKGRVKEMTRKFDNSPKNVNPQSNQPSNTKPSPKQDNKFDKAKPKMGFGRPKQVVKEVTPPKKNPQNSSIKEKSFRPPVTNPRTSSDKKNDTIANRKFDPRPPSSKKPVNQNIRPTKVNTQSTDEYRKINIVWDKSLLTSTLKKLGASKKQADIERLIVKVDGAIKKYIKVKKDINTKIDIPKGFGHCNNNETNIFEPKNFTENLTIESDLFIFLYAVSENSNTLAAAAPCLKNENDRTYIGRLLVNIDNLKFTYGNYYEQFNEVNVIFHEVLHIMAFHSYMHKGLVEEIKKSTFPTKFKYLKELSYIRDDPLLGEAHWNEAYLPNDLMIPVDRIDSKLTIFSLEYLDLVSNEIKTERKNLPNNFLLDEITDLKDFFSYKCTSGLEKSKYSLFCTEKQFHKGGSSCDRSRLYKSACGNSVLKNGCTSMQSLKNYICTDSNVDPKKKNRFEYYGEDSRCFEGKASNGTPQSLCLQFESNSKGILVTSAGSQYQCTREGEVIKMSVEEGEYIYSTEFICPNPKEFKRIYNLTNCPFNCFGNGHCSDGQCLCFDGYEQSTHCRTLSQISNNGARFTSALNN
jgi:hypothetical protein